MWMIIAIVVIVAAVLLVIASIAMGTALFFTRKQVKSATASEFAPHQGIEITRLFLQRYSNI